MKTLLKYNTEEYTIEQTSFDSNLVAKTESMMALGNGYLGLRSVDEEVESYNKEDLLVNGIFNKDSEEEVTEIANLADLIQLPIFLDGKRFVVSSNDEYNKEINLKNGLLTRVIKAKRDGKEFELTFKRFVSQANKHVYASFVEIKQLSGEETKITVMPRINGQTTNNGTQHFKEGQKRRPTLKSVQYQEETTFSKRFVVHNLLTNPKVNGKELEAGTDDYVVTMDRRQVGFKINTTISQKDVFTLERLMSVNTSIENANGDIAPADVIKTADKLHEELSKTNFDKLFEESTKAWEPIWGQFDIAIKGDSEEAKYDRMSFAFSIFHLNSFVPKDDSNLSVGAKGLSGEGYQGHSFWDTEFFINPNYLYTKPEVVRNLLEYRYKGIDGARAKAAEKKEREEESNLKGAQFPWEMAWPTDGEVCPYWGQADVVTGQQVPIASRRQEIHVPADIAFAVDQYFDFTNDEKFMNEMGYEIIIDTAIFWAYRAEKQSNGKYMIKDVMGPNEYKGNIDNNAYINAFAAKNLELAFKYMDKLSSTDAGKKVLDAAIAKIPYEVPVDLMKDVLANLVQQEPNKDLIIAENDQFLGLDRIDVSPFQLLGDAGKKLFSTKEGHKRLCSQLVKQADVVLLTFLMPDKFSREVVEANFDFYEPITTHDSSLSPTTYAIQAIDLRKMDLAYKLFNYSLGIDMGPNMKSCDKGIHAGSIAAIWQSIVFGYGGLRWVDGTLRFTPILPKQWDGLDYSVKYQGKEIAVSVSKDKFTLKLLKGDSLNVMVNGKEVSLNNKEQEFEVVK